MKIFLKKLQSPSGKRIHKREINKKTIIFP
jgi:hypothetical protein